MQKPTQQLADDPLSDPGIDLAQITAELDACTSDEQYFSSLHTYLTETRHLAVTREEARRYLEVTKKDAKLHVHALDELHDKLNQDGQCVPIDVAQEEFERVMPREEDLKRLVREEFGDDERLVAGAEEAIKCIREYLIEHLR